MTAFFMAWGMFCSIPCPCKKWDETKYSQMLLCLPLIGLLIGGIWLGAAWLLNLAGGLGLFGAAVLTILPFLLSGFIHLDGYMDCADAILSRRDLEQRRRILKDSHVGSFAVICLVILMLLEFALLGEANRESGLLCLLFIPAVSRACAGAAVLNLKPMETSSYEKMFAGGIVPFRRGCSLIFMALLVAAPLVFCGLTGLCAAAAAAGSWLTIACCRKNLGGMSGDISGCAITVGEGCALVAWTFPGLV